MKYYVLSGSFSDIVNANSPQEAAIIAFRRCKEPEKHTVSPVVWVNEHGFNSEYQRQYDDEPLEHFLVTEDVIRESWQQ